jgi:uncharacterized membrane protein
LSIAAIISIKSIECWSHLLFFPQMVLTNSFLINFTVNQILYNQVLISIYSNLGKKLRNYIYIYIYILMSFITYLANHKYQQLLQSLCPLQQSLLYLQYYIFIVNISL